MSKKKIIVHDPAFDHLPDEKSVTLYKASHFGESIHIHPWTRNRAEVSIALGRLNKKGQGDDEKDNWELAIFDREDFVEAVLAVFPELKRVN